MMLSNPGLLDWTSLHGWRDAILDLASTAFGFGVNRHWAKSQPSPSEYWDDPTRMEPLCKKVQRNSDDLFAELGRLLPQVFDKVRAVHLCRPVDFDSYRKRGLLRSDLKQLQDDLMQFFSQKHPEVSAHEIARAVSLIPPKYRDGRVFFGIDERAYFDSADHYAISGSEYQQAIAVQITGDGKTDYVKTLSARGKPAYVIAHLPLELVDSDTIKFLSRDLILTALWTYQLNKDYSPKNWMGFELTMDVPPSMIHDIVDATNLVKSDCRR